MEEREIMPDQCYRLENGQVIWITTVHPTQVRCDIYDQEQMMWIKHYDPIPLSMLKERCADPSINRGG
jgi:hypothetical protein